MVRHWRSIRVRRDLQQLVTANSMIKSFNLPFAFQEIFFAKIFPKARTLLLAMRRRIAPNDKVE